MSQRSEPSREHAAPSERFVSQLTAVQGALYAYVCVLLGGSHSADDVLQETNLVLWRKAHEFNPELSFTAWAYKIAFNQVLAYRKRRAGDRHLSNISDDSLGRIAAKVETQVDSLVQRAKLLDQCIEKLPDYQRRLIGLRYAEHVGVKAIANKLDKSENSVAATLYRARLALIDCVETQPKTGGDGS